MANNLEFVLGLQGIPNFVANIMAADAAVNGFKVGIAAMDFMKLASNAQLVQRVMSQTRGDATVFAAWAAVWEIVKADAGIFKSHIDSVWAAVAGVLTPAFEKLLKRIDDLTAKLGPAIADAFRQGQVEDLLSLALQAGFEQGGYYGEKMFAGLAAGLGSAVLTALQEAFLAAKMSVQGLVTGAKFAEAESARWSAEQRLADAQKWGDKPMEAQARADIAAANAYEQQLAADQAAQNAATMKAVMGTMAKGVQDGFTQGMHAFEAAAGPAPTAAKEALKRKIAGLFNDWTKLYPGGTTTAGGAASSGPLLSHYKPEFTSFEKMGFIMGGGHSNVMRPTEELLRQIRDRLPQSPQPPIDSLTGYPLVNAV